MVSRMQRGTLKTFMACLALGGAIGAIALAVVISSQQQKVPGEASAQMTSPNLIEIIEVDSVEHLHQHEPPAPGPSDEPLPRLQSIDEVRRQMGLVYTPSYLPAGFALEGSRTSDGHIVETVYLSDQLELSIVQDSVAAQPRVKRGYVELVSVNGRPAHLVRGIWHRIVKDGNVSEAEWDPDFMLSVIFQIDNHWFLVEADTEFGEAELLKVAESIRPSP